MSVATLAAMTQTLVWRSSWVSMVTLQSQEVRPMKSRQLPENAEADGAVKLVTIEAARIIRPMIKDFLNIFI